MLRILRQVRSDILAGENIDVYLILLVSLVLAVAGVISIANFSILASGILAVLSLLSVGLLSLRRTTKDLYSGLSKAKRTAVLQRQSELTVSRPEFEMSQTIDWMAFSMYKTFSIYSNEICKCLERGGIIRVLLVNPNNHLPDDLVYLGYSFNKEHLKTTINSTITRLRHWQNEMPNCKLEVRFLDSVPPYRIVILNKGTAAGRIRLRLFSTPGNEDVPAFEITSADDPQWFQFFVEQYERIWQLGKPVSLKP